MCCDMTHSHMVWHDSFIYGVTWLINIWWDMIEIERLVPGKNVNVLICCGMTDSYEVTWLIHIWFIWWIGSMWCDMSDVLYDSYGVTWRIQIERLVPGENMDRPLSNFETKYIQAQQVCEMSHVSHVHMIESCHACVCALNASCLMCTYERVLYHVMSVSHVSHVHTHVHTSESCVLPCMCSYKYAMSHMYIWMSHDPFIRGSWPTSYVYVHTRHDISESCLVCTYAWVTSRMCSCECIVSHMNIWMGHVLFISASHVSHVRMNESCHAYIQWMRHVSHVHMSDFASNSIVTHPMSTFETKYI